MDTTILLVVILSFVLSFIFALGGVGSALVIVPALTWIGLPFAHARSVGLFVNGVSMIGATYSNIRNKRLDFKLGLPIIAASIILAPIGAWVGHLIPTRYLLVVFITFLFFSGTMMLFFKSSKYADQYREDRPVVGPLLTGVLAGFLSGLLGVGGGGVISPLMIVQGFNPKKVATITAFSVPFSSLSAFFAYAAMGSVPWNLLIFAGVAAWIGGYLGTIVMHQKMQPATVKKFLGFIILLLASRLAFSL
ncbi:sulfite exporter TauE/SafE family protein [Vibrio sp. JC009]|uniref:sulfite exporter TauE/SafE family protein n=1 Tax=Vibrio sp. JC009 TaxID=2912314 RepID=UPI0023AFBFB7|nr:sulfite exporter TauE/SafE family protein [Vibrio sp. JC009]WED24891.1 sulfite exporter TauE/SafE family protein [Vibrio sp. JC009]